MEIQIDINDLEAMCDLMCPEIEEDFEDAAVDE